MLSLCSLCSKVSEFVHPFFPPCFILKFEEGDQPTKRGLWVTVESMTVFFSSLPYVFFDCIYGGIAMYCFVGKKPRYLCNKMEDLILCPLNYLTVKFLC